MMSLVYTALYNIGLCKYLISYRNTSRSCEKQNRKYFEFHFPTLLNRRKLYLIGEQTTIVYIFCTPDFRQCELPCTSM